LPAVGRLLLGHTGVCGAAGGVVPGATPPPRSTSGVCAGSGSGGCAVMAVTGPFLAGARLNARARRHANAVAALRYPPRRRANGVLARRLGITV
jgi:hypothetical protein